MILKKGEQFNSCSSVCVDEFDDVLFPTCSNIKCFGFGGAEHVIKACYGHTKGEGPQGLTGGSCHRAG